MSININVNDIDKSELYWTKEKVCDAAFIAESKYKQAKTEKSRNKWWDLFLKILGIQRELEQRLDREFGYSH